MGERELPPFRLDLVPRLRVALFGGEAASPPLLPAGPPASSALRALLAAKTDDEPWHAAEKDQLLRLLAEILVFDRALTAAALLPICRPIFPDLLHRACSAASFELTRHEALGELFVATLPSMPHLLPQIVRYYQTPPCAPPFERLVQACANSDLASLRRVAQTTHWLVTEHLEAFGSLWRWGPFFQLLLVDDVETRWFAASTLAAIVGLRDLERRALLEAYTGPSAADQPAIHLRRAEGAAAALRHCYLHNSLPLVDISGGSGSLITASDLSLDGGLVDVCGLLCARLGAHAALPGALLVDVPTTRANLHSLALATTLRLPVLLEGPTGAGKSSLVRHFAAQCGISPGQLFTVQMGDQTDAKALLGAYLSTDIPGHFRYQPGVLVEAVTRGRWVVIEDIDLAPLDVVSLLIPLLESRRLFVPGRGEEFVAAEGFRLFATRRVANVAGSSLRSAGAAALLEPLLTRVVVTPPSYPELATILVSLFPVLVPLVDRILGAFAALTAPPPPGSPVPPGGLRTLSPRDLFKWCRRVAARNTETTLLTAMQEGLDCFAAAIPSLVARGMVAVTMASHFDIAPENLHALLHEHHPLIVAGAGHLDAATMFSSGTVADGTMAVGRATLPCAPVSAALSGTGVFAQTRTARLLLEQLAVCVSMGEPVLLVGETGTGKTTAVQHLADMLGRPYSVVNMSQQSDSSDLLGGFKPVNLKTLLKPALDTFENLFFKTFSRKQNAAFVERVHALYLANKPAQVLTAFQNTLALVKDRFDLAKAASADGESELVEQASDASSAKKKKTSNRILQAKWQAFEAQVSRLAMQASGGCSFAFSEGALLKAATRGEWILLDELNLATSETLECLNGLLEATRPDGSGGGASLILTERGDLEPVRVHPDFRVFACMNPATDVGKRDLPPGIRNRFTEFYVEEMSDPRDLSLLVRTYLGRISSGPLPDDLDSRIVALYLEIKELTATRMLRDGSNQSPHYSLRTLCRGLLHAECMSLQCPPLHAVVEGLSMSFQSQLDSAAYSFITAAIQRHLGTIPKVPLRTEVPGYIRVGDLWLPQGPLEPSTPEQYIMTPSVEANLRHVSRVIASRRFPVLLQGPTSAGKTSIIEYLAQRTGHRFVRINNHEHTDIQEYMGSYVSNERGELVFHEGALVEAVRQGYWLVLDELNLAPTDVLEALNRLLDDNRELFVYETQELVRPHPNFMLFATQNPPGLYGGRKTLSRAFRNRFVELHFSDIPVLELVNILHRRCGVAEKFCQRFVHVMLELQRHRQGTRMFAGKHGFITLRDLFRWAERYKFAAAQCSRGDLNHEQLLAEDGYILLAERVRSEDEKKVVVACLEKNFKCVLNIAQLYSCQQSPLFKELQQQLIDCRENPQHPMYPFRNVVWTAAMKRLFTVVERALHVRDPLLLVGETGCGKTTIFQIFAVLLQIPLQVLNCHEHTETSDFLGGLRPVRALTAAEPYPDKPEGEVAKNEGIEDSMESASAGEPTASSRRLFEWVDGPLVEAMRQGSLFLIDEISLADDSVLERINSVLEPARLLVLAEKGSETLDEIVAAPSFALFATMNPGGDFGKKELSPALRNRFNEVWVPAVSDPQDLLAILEHLLDPSLTDYAPRILHFMQFLLAQRVVSVVSLRDYVSWTTFMNHTRTILGSAAAAFVHAACITMIDGVSHDNTRQKCLAALLELLPEAERIAAQRDQGHAAFLPSVQPSLQGNLWGMAPFFVPCGSLPRTMSDFTLQVPTSAQNAFRVLRAMQLSRPILLEGSPGVGKTSLVLAMARACGQPIVRLNLSEQTDVTDLFGSDLPVEGSVGEFSWRDGPLLQALRTGAWVLLDELNLASQSVLEGLNACLDHRGSVYIPELNRTFVCEPSRFRLFACQNPLSQGGGRKGLPKSFLNRFTQVHVAALTDDDLVGITVSRYPTLGEDVVRRMVGFTAEIQAQVCTYARFGRGCTDFNLRDVFRWADLVVKYQMPGLYNPVVYADLIFAQRMRTGSDRRRTRELLAQYFRLDVGEVPASHKQTHIAITPSHIQVGHTVLSRMPNCGGSVAAAGSALSLCPAQLSALESLATGIDMGWLVTLVGPRSSGKTSLVKTLAALSGHRLREFAMNSAVDTMELLGGFEQVDLTRASNQLRRAIDAVARASLGIVLSRPSTASMKLAREIEHLGHVAQTSCCAPAWSDESAAHVSAFLDLIEQHLGSLECLQEVFVEATAALAEIKKAAPKAQSGSFQWTNGMLIEALERGDWLLIDNVNFCNPSVLDRLNGLLEPGGVLVLGERGVIDGSVPVITPHKNFRLICAMDPNNGEISRAMKNRGLEVFVEPPVADVTRKLLSNVLIWPGANSIDVLHSLHYQIVESTPSLARQLSVRALLQAAALFQALLHRGLSADVSLVWSFTQIYRRRCASSADADNISSLIHQAASALANSSQAAKRIYLTGPLLAGNELLHQADFLPGAIPVPIFSLSWLLQDSTQACVSRAGCVLEWLARSAAASSARDKTHILFEPLLQAVCAAVENTPPEDLQLFLQWSEAILSTLNVASSADTLAMLRVLLPTLIRHPLINQRLRLAASWNDTLLLKQPTDFRANEILWRRLSLHDAEKTVAARELADKVFALIRWLADRSLEKGWEDACSVNQLRASPLGQSFLCKKGLMDAARCENGVIVSFSPFLEEIDRLAEQFLSSAVQVDLSWLGALLEARRDFWSAGMGRLPHAGEEAGLVFYVHWAALIRLLRQAPSGWADSAHLQNLQDKICQVFPVSPSSTVTWFPGFLMGRPFKRQRVHAMYSKLNRLAQQWQAPVSPGELKALLEYGHRPRVWSGPSDSAEETEELNRNSFAQELEGGDGVDVAVATIPLRFTRQLKSLLVQALATAHVLDDTLVAGADIFHLDEDSAATADPGSSGHGLPEAALPLFRVVAQCHEVVEVRARALPLLDRTVGDSLAALWPVQDWLSLQCECEAVELLLQAAAEQFLLGITRASPVPSILKLLTVSLETGAPRSASELYPYQQWLWAHEAGRDETLNLLGRVLVTHQVRAWNNTFDLGSILASGAKKDTGSLVDVEGLRGMLNMDFATLSYCIFPLLRLSQVSLGNMPAKIEQIRLLRAQLTNHISPSILAPSSRLAQQARYLRLRAIMAGAEISTWLALDEAHKLLRSNLAILLTTVDASLLAADENGNFLFALEAIINLALEHAPKSLEADVISLLIPALRDSFTAALDSEALGRALVLLGLWQVRGSCPKSALDPVVEDAMRLGACRRRGLRLSAAVDVRAYAQESAHGIPDSYRGSLLAAEADAVRVEGREKLARLVLRPTPSQYPALVAELAQFLTTYSFERLIAVISRLHHQDNLAEEAALQQTLSGFVATLRGDRFALYPDITQTAVIGILDVQRGLRLIRNGATVARDEAAATRVLSRLAHNHITLNSPYDAAKFWANAEVKRAISGFWVANEITAEQWQDRLLHWVARDMVSAVDARGVLTPVGMHVFDLLLSSFAERFSSQESARQAAEEAKNALFKYKDRALTSEADEAEQLTREFERFFPNYAHDFADILPPNPSDNTAKESPVAAAELAEDAAFEKDQARMLELSRAHAAVMNMHGPAPLDALLSARASFRQEQFELTSILQQHMAEPLGAAYDVALWGTAHGQIEQILGFAGSASRSNAELGDLSTKAAVVQPNVHLDGNLAETQRAVPILNSMTARVAELLEEFPENEILGQMWNLIHRLLSFPVDTPVMKMLTGLDLLLSRAQDWQLRASKRVSLQDHLQSISHLMLEWRELELVQWPLLLQQVQDRLCRKSSRAWGSLYALLTGIPAPDQIDSQLLATHDQLHSWLAGGSLGEFDYRLSVLGAFSLHVTRLAEVQKQDPAAANFRQRLSQLLSSIVRFFTLYAPQVADKISAVRKPLAREIKDHIKLVRWKDTNYDAMKAAAIKTRAALHRLTRKFENGLLEAAQTALGTPKLPPGAVAPSQLPSSGISLPVSNVSPSGRAQALDELTTAVVERIQELRDWDAKFAGQKPKLKHGRLMKQRGLALLLKELARIGLNYRRVLDESTPILFRGLSLPDPKVPEDVPGGGDAAWMKACWADSNLIFFQNLARNQELKTAASQPHKDIPSLDVARFGGFLGDLLNVQLKQRHLAVKFFAGYRDAALLLSCAADPEPAPETMQYKARAALKVQIEVLGSALLILADMHVAGSPRVRDLLAPQLQALHKLQEDAVQMTRASSLQYMTGALGTAEADPPLPLAEDDSKGPLRSLPVVAISGNLCRKIFGHHKAILKLMQGLVTSARSDPELSERAVNHLHDLNDLAVQAEAAFSLALQQDCAPTKATVEEEEQHIRCVLEMLLRTMRQLVKHERKAARAAALASAAAVADARSQAEPIDEFQTAAATADEGQDEEDSAEAAGPVLAAGHFLQAHNDMVQSMQLLDLPAVVAAAALLPTTLLPRIHAELSGVVQSCARVATEFSLLHKNVCKMYHILGNLATDLFQRGFCKPPEEEENKDNSPDEEGQELEGTGIGEGKGGKDVSKEITDEEQVLGTRDEPPPPPPGADDDQDMPEEDDGLEMSGDFEGELYDRDPKDKDEDDNDDSDDELDKDELDQQMGDVETGKGEMSEDRPMDQDKPDGNDEEEGTNELKEEQGQAGGRGSKEREMVAGDNDDDPEDQSGAENTEEPQDKRTKNAEQDQEESDAGGPDKEDSDSAGPDEFQATKPEQKAPEGNSNQDGNENGEEGEEGEEGDEKKPGDLDLPDDLQLDGEAADEDRHEAGSDDEDGKGSETEDHEGENQDTPQENMDVDDKSGHDEERPADELAQADQPDELPLPPEGDDMEDDNMQVAQPPENEKSLDATNEAEKARTMGEEAPTKEKDLASPPSTSQGEEMGQKEGGQAPEDAGRAPDASATVESGDGGASNTVHQANAAPSESFGGDPDGGLEQNGASMSQDQRGAQRSGSKPQPSTLREPLSRRKYEHHPEANPYRDLGDASKAWQDRLQARDADQNTAPEPPTGSDVTLDAEEFVFEQEQQNSGSSLSDPGLQATGLATEEQKQKGRFELEEEEGDSSLPQPVEEAPEEMALDVPKALAEKVEAVVPLGEFPAEENGSKNGDEELGEEMRADASGDQKKKDNPDEEELVTDEIQRLEQAVARPPGQPALTETELQALRQLLEEELQAEVEAAAADSAGPGLTTKSSGDLENMWHQFESLTFQLSQDLCEQLRLVLEASLAAKMRGDYRTGKRLNMRKIIPYIASQFRKDKIWLRRTKPSKREYQVMLAIDDSQSMSLYHSRQLALESLCVISNAMTRLEVGELAVMSYGNTSKVVHPFGEPFSAATGAHLLQQFSFQQSRTMVGSLLEHAAAVFSEAKAHKRSTGLTTDQLLFIVSDSDNLYQEGEAVVERWLRTCSDLGILVVFVVIDSPEKEHSVMDQKTVSFVGGRLQTREYMDRFADKNYVVLRNTASLPELLADMLRQWFETVTASGDK